MTRSKMDMVRKMITMCSIMMITKALVTILQAFEVITMVGKAVHVPAKVVMIATAMPPQMMPIGAIQDGNSCWRRLKLDWEKSSRRGAPMQVTERRWQIMRTKGPGGVQSGGRDGSWRAQTRRMARLPIPTMSWPSE